MVSSTTHPADYAALGRFAGNPDRFPQLAAAFRAGGVKCREALAALIAAREEAVKTGGKLRDCGYDAEATLSPTY